MSWSWFLAGTLQHNSRLCGGTAGRPLPICSFAEYLSKYSWKCSRPRRGKEDTFAKCLPDWSRLKVHPPQQVSEAMVTHISKAGADIGTDRSFAWAFDILILDL